MNKSIKLFFIYLIIVSSIYSSASFTGLTGGVDFPSANILINRHYTIQGIISSNDEDLTMDVAIETGFIPQVEAGIKLSTAKNKFDQSFLQANFKYQLVPEGKDNPAIAIGFTEFDSYEVQGDKSKENKDDSPEAYAFLVLTKSFKERMYNFSLGLSYSQSENSNNTNIFAISDIALADKVRLLTEAYSYDRNSNKKVSFNLGAEFFTKENIITKVYFRERNHSVGVSICYFAN